MSAGDPRTLQLGPSYKVAPTPTLRAELEQVLGPGGARGLTRGPPAHAARGLGQPERIRATSYRSRSG